MDKKYPSSTPEARKAWLATQDPEKLKTQRQAQYARKIARGGEEERRHAYYEANKEHIKAKTKQYAKDNQDKVKAAHAVYYQEHAEEIKAKVKTWKQANPRPEAARKNQLKMKFGITPEDFSTMLVAQGGVCAICKGDNPISTKQFHVDHDHKTGKIRSILCHHCNTGLGHFKDSPVLLRTAADYIDRHNQIEHDTLTIAG